MVTGTITVTGGTLTVDSGVEVRFRSGTGLKIRQANVNVNGLLGSEILWTSLSDSLGEWGSIYYDSNSDDGVASDWSYAVIEKGWRGHLERGLHSFLSDEHDRADLL